MKIQDLYHQAILDLRQIPIRIREYRLESGIKYVSRDYDSRHYDIINSFHYTVNSLEGLEWSLEDCWNHMIQVAFENHHPHDWHCSQKTKSSQQYHYRGKRSYRRQEHHTKKDAKGSRYVDRKRSKKPRGKGKWKRVCKDISHSQDRARTRYLIGTERYDEFGTKHHRKYTYYDYW